MIVFGRIKSFNPRTRTGCDIRYLAQDTGFKEFQSTHPHGVRQRKKSGVPEIYMFQSTHPHGVRQNKYNQDYLPNQFQSTHPHGVRR